MKIEWFPKDEPRAKPTLIEAYIHFFFWGFVGGHHFYLGNTKRGVFLLSCFIIPMALLFLFPLIPQFVSPALVKIVSLGVLLLGAPLFIWDLFSLPWQVKSKGGSPRLYYP